MLWSGKAQYSCLPDGKGGIVDDIIVHQTGENEYLIVVNASNIEKDWNWMLNNEQGRGTNSRMLPSFSQLALQGPWQAIYLPSDRC
jgi:aminomethyltransferase